jgi:hypothetical protein
MLNKKTVSYLVIGIIAVLIIAVGYSILVNRGPSLALPIAYRNAEYGFSFSLPASWEGYSIVTDQWQGFLSSLYSNELVERGPLISIRHPLWTDQEHRQDIPIMIFTLSQWNALQRGQFTIGAAPIKPTELGRNAKYVFALPARYNYSFPSGWEEVEKILQNKPLHAF